MKISKTSQLIKERDEARSIVRAIYWMARRYANGRCTTAASTFNEAISKAYESGWLDPTGFREPAFARDGHFDLPHTSRDSDF